MSRLFDVACSVVSKDYVDMSSVAACDGFLGAVKKTFLDFLKSIHEKCHSQLLDDVHSFTDVLDFSSSGSAGAGVADSISASVSEAIKLLQDEQPAKAMDVLTRLLGQREGSDSRQQRVLDIMSKHNYVFPAAGSQLTDATYQTFISLCRKMFDSIRFKVVELVRNKMSTLILKPMFESLREVIMQHYRDISVEHLTLLQENGVFAMTKERDALKKKVQYTAALRDKFREVSKKVADQQANKEI